MHRDDPQEQVVWPPQFESFESYKARMDAAIEAHPPFGTYLRKHIRVEALTGGNTGYHVPGTSIDDLKKQYIKQAEINARCANTNRYFAEVYLTDNADKYKAAEEKHALEREAHETAAKKWDEFHTAKIRNLPPRPREPNPPPEVQEKTRLLRIAEDRVQDPNAPIAT